jgi:hypothetical protein
MSGAAEIRYRFWLDWSEASRPTSRCAGAQSGFLKVREACRSPPDRRLHRPRPRLPIENAKPF